MIRLAAGLLLIMVSLAAASPAAGQGGQVPQDPIDRYVGKPIVAVEIQIEGRVDTSPALAELIDMKPGDLLTLTALRRLTDRLHQVPRFEGVKVLAEDIPGGLKIIFDLTPKHPIAEMSFTPESQTGIPAAELDRLIREQFNGLPVTTPLREIEAEVREILRDEGYLSASVHARVTPLEPEERSMLGLAVQAGQRTTIARSEITGASTFDPDKLKSRLEILPGAPLRKRALDVALADVRDELRGKRFSTATARVLEVTYSDDLATASIVVRVEAGPVVVIRIQGDGLPGDQDDFIPVQRLNSVDTDLLDDAQRAIDREWRVRGYKNSRTAYRQDDANGTLTITFTIERGRRFRIARIDWPAGLEHDPRDREAMKPLRVDEWFDRERVEFYLLRVKARYQERGHYRVVLEPTYLEVPGRSPAEGGVVVQPNITPGPRATVTGITFDLGPSPRVAETDLRPLLRAAVGQPYYVGNLSEDENSLIDYYQKHGFLDRVVQVRPVLAPSGTEVQLTIYAREGTQVRVGEIIVVGARNMSRAEVLRELTFGEGDIYSEVARAESERQLYRTTTYRSVQVRRDPRLPGESTVRIIVSVTEADRTPFGFGAGLEGGTRPRAVPGGSVEDRLEFAPRAFIELGRRAIGGKNRAVSFYARVSFKPKNAPGDPAQDGRGFGFPEYRVTSTYTERYAFNSSSDILALVTSEQAIRTSFNFIRRIGSFAVIRPLTPRISAQGRYSLEWTKLFDTAIPPEQQPIIDRLFPQVRLSIVSLGVIWDRRDNPLNTKTGEQVDANLDVALKPLGSEVGFVKFFSQASFFRPIAESPVTFAARAQVGLAKGASALVPDLPASHRYFAGGSTSVRGFQLDRLGVDEILNENGLSNGGNAMVVFNVELRTVVAQLFRRNFSVVGFVDTGNVFHRVGDLDLGRLRTSVGMGARYDSWIGPIRVDVGVKTDRMFFANAKERRWEIHLSIGEVF